MSESENHILKNLQSLLTHPREKLEIELKGWLDLTSPRDRANLAKAIMAIANHCGGYVIIGYTKDNGGWIPDEQYPSVLSGYSQDNINSVVIRYAEPSFHVDVQHVMHPEKSQRFPIIVIPGNHRIPIRAKRSGPNEEHLQSGKYYIRRPGPQSEPPQSGQEWDNFLSKCMRAQKEELLEAISNLLSPSAIHLSPAIPRFPGILPSGISISSGEIQEKEKLSEWSDSSIIRWSSRVSEELADEKPDRYSHGIWHISYSILGEYDKPNLKQLLEILKKVEGRETGWPPWMVPRAHEIRPRKIGDSIECWIRPVRVKDGAHSDFWRASSDVYLFLLRGYDEDSQITGATPGTVIDFILPVWRISECVLHAERLATELNATSGSILFKVVWKGLTDRRLVSIVQPRRFLRERGTSSEYSIPSDIIVPVERISTHLPEIVKELTNPLYMSFDFFDLPLDIIKEEISKLRGKRFEQRVYEDLPDDKVDNFILQSEKIHPKLKYEARPAKSGKLNHKDIWSYLKPGKEP